jgi:hypothetical protein
MTFNHTIAGLDTQRMFLTLLRVGELIVPLKGERVVVIAIVGITFPIARQTDNVRWFFKTAVANQFGVESSFDALVHEFQKLSVEQGTDVVLNLASVDRNRCPLSRLRYDDEVRLSKNGRKKAQKAQENA